MTRHPNPTTSLQLAVFGATSGVGLHLVGQALAAGHRVTALVRERARMTLADPRLTVIEGDATDPAAVRRAVAGTDAVVCALGAPALRRSHVRAEGTRCIVDAMHAEGVTRLVCVSVLGAAESRAVLPWALRWLMFPLYLRWAGADHEAQETIVRNSDLRWSIVRPPFLTDGPHTGDYADGLRGDEPGLTLKISRADVADLLLRQITEGRDLGRAVGISYVTASAGRKETPSPRRPSAAAPSGSR